MREADDASCSAVAVLGELFHLGLVGRDDCDLGTGEDGVEGDEYDLQDKGYGYVAGIHGEFRIRAFARGWKRKRGNRLLFRFFTTQKT